MKIGVGINNIHEYVCAQISELIDRFVRFSDIGRWSHGCGNSHIYA